MRIFWFKARALSRRHNGGFKVELGDEGDSGAYRYKCWRDDRDEIIEEAFRREDHSIYLWEKQ
jgi:hypothetical protein